MTGEIRQPLLFLDIDGVLNAHAWDAVAGSNRIDGDKVAILNEILAAAHAGVVLSSAWRYLVNREEMTIGGLDWLLRSHGVMAGALVGITGPDTPISFDGAGRPTAFLPDERASQVAEYRRATGHVGPFAVLDDLDLGFTRDGLPFVQTDGSTGLTREDAARAVELLTRSRECVAYESN